MSTGTLARSWTALCPTTYGWKHRERAPRVLYSLHSGTPFLLSGLICPDDQEDPGRIGGGAFFCVGVGTEMLRDADRFIMPGAAEEPMADSPWYGFDFGPVHFTVISTEHDFSVGSKQVPANPLLFGGREPAQLRSIGYLGDILCIKRTLIGNNRVYPFSRVGMKCAADGCTLFRLPFRPLKCDASRDASQY